MRPLKTTFAVLFFLSVTPFTYQAISQNMEIEELHQKYVTMINTGNLAGVDALYTQDASIRNSDGSMTIGLDNIKTYYKATFDSGKFNLTIKTNEVKPLSRDYTFVSGYYTYEKTDEPKMILKGEFVNTLKKEKGDWKLYKSYRYLETTNNASVVNGAYNAFAVGDIPAVLGAMDPKIVWNEAESNRLADGNPYIGPDAVLKGVFARISEDFDGFKLTNIVLHEMTGNKVLATLRYNGTSKHNGKVMDIQAAHLWTVKDGKIIAFQQYADTMKLHDATVK